MRASRVLSVALTVLATNAAVGGLVWEKSSYVVSEWTQPEKRLLPAGVDKDKKAMVDGIITTYVESPHNVGYTYTWDSPKDVETIQLYVMDKALENATNHGLQKNMRIKSVSLLYDGDTAYTELPNPNPDPTADHAVNYIEKVPDGHDGMGKLLIFKNTDGFIGKRLRGVKVSSGYWEVNTGIGFGEFVVTGEESVNESLSADYQVSLGRYSVSGSAVAADYPLDVYFCSGATDGGETIENWDSAVRIATLTSSNDKYEISGAADFAFCRLYFTSPRYGDVVWSPGLKVDGNPAAVVSLAERRTDSATLALAIQSTGSASSSCDVYFASALSGEEMPAVVLIKAAARAGEVVTKGISGLPAGASCNYKFVIRNPESGETTVEGAFSTVNPGYWTRNDFSGQTYARPEHWLSGGHIEEPLYYGMPTVSAVTVKDNKTHTWTFKEAKDIKSVGVYTKWGNADAVAFEVLSIDVKYSADGEFVSIPGTYLAREWVSEYKDETGQVAKFLPVEDFIAQGVYALRLRFGDINWGIGCVALEVVGVNSEGPGDWSVDSYAAEDYVRPADVLGGGTGAELLYDGLFDGTVVAYANSATKGVFTWDFPRAQDLRALRIFTRGVDNGGNEQLWRTKLGIKSIEVKYKGETDFTVLPGSSLDSFGLGKIRTVAVYGPKEGKFFARNVVALRFSVGYSDNNGVTFAELEALGRETPRGLMLLIR